MAATPGELPEMSKELLKTYYLPDPQDVPARARKLLQEYGNIPAEQVLPHVLRVRDQAWKVFPYPCIGQFKFLDLGVSQSPCYAEVLERIISGQKLLDVGCCVGQEIRQLAHDGAPSENLYGTDLHTQFLEIGYTLFKDKDTLKSTFFAADIFSTDSPLTALSGTLDVIWAGSFLHLFSWDGDVAAIKRIIAFLKPQKDSLVFGKQMGNVSAGEFVHSGALQQTMFRHNEASFKHMWKQAGVETGTAWNVSVQSEDIEAESRAPEGSIALRFAVRRL